ncbi:MAG: hypothetical protein ACK6BG_01695 [Cyanobacteriota bacterium]
MSAGPRPGRGRGCWSPGGGLRSVAPLGAWPLLLVLSACAGTPWGERLAGSFPPAEAPLPTGPSRTREAPPPGQTAPPPAVAARPTPPAAPSVPKGPAAPKAPTPSPAPKPPPASTTAPDLKPLAPPVPPATASPYRVTLRLPRADPSAPAEAVTRALRTAGIPFEVETIERVEASGLVPTVRPAPPPR